MKTTGAKAATYGYDLAGNTTTRPGTQATQTLAWNSEGELASTTEPAAGTKPALGTGYLYDADGELLIRRATGDGDTVLYLGTTEVRLTVKGTAKTVTGTRYYSAAGQTLAVRTATSGTTGTKLSFLAADHHGTSSIATDATTQAVTKRYSTPFGAPRGTKPTSWPDDKTFLGKPTDSATGLTHIGARAYDPGVGQFISVDPLLEIDKHQTLNGYSYAGQSPATNSDPTGTCLDPGNGRCQPGDNSGTPDPSFPINSNPAPDTSGTATAAPAKAGSSSGPRQGDNVPAFAEGIYYGVGEAFYGLIGNVPRAGEYFGWTWDSDCRSDAGPGGAGCDYGAQYDQWMSEQGYDTSSDAYLVPGAIAAFFSHRELISPKSATKFRNANGSSNGGVRLPEVTGKWLKGRHGNAGKIPGQIARQLQGEQFKNFGEFREAFWRAVAADPSLSSQFRSSNQANMREGRAPKVARSQAVGKNNAYVLHHVKPIQHGGGVYDMDNIIVVTPRYHQEVLDPTYHQK